MYGITTSDSHGADTVDDAWVWALMKEQTTANLRGSLESGAFISAIKGDVAKAEPTITEVIVSHGTITVTATNHEAIRWISDGKIIATGSALSLAEHRAELGAYVRAEVLGEGGTLYTQPFLLSYEGMPAGRPVPSDYVDEGRRIAFIRTLLYPFLWVLDGIWKMISCW